MLICKRCGRYYTYNSRSVRDEFCEKNCRMRADQPMRGTTGKQNLKMISLEEFNRMLLEQKSVCAICKKPETTGKDFAVDHCHSTGKIRGLLCVKCNIGIGFFNDDEWLMRDAADYLERSKR